MTSADKLAVALKDILDVVAVTETMGEICQCSDFSDAREALAAYEADKAQGVEAVTVDEFAKLYATIISCNPKSDTPKMLGYKAAKGFAEFFPNGLIVKGG